MIKSFKPVIKMDSDFKSKSSNKLGFTESLMMTMNIENKSSSDSKAINTSLKNKESLEKHCGMMSNKTFYKKQSARQKRSPESDEEG